jgi:DNA polymerase-3 subunit chi
MLFYHMERQPLERVLPALLEKSLERGWRVVVQAASDERVEALDAHLWTYRDDGFLPHGTYKESAAREQPILITVNDDNPNQAAVRFLVDGAPVPADALTYERIVVLFDGEDPDAVDAARTRWTTAKAEGFAVTYWQSDSDGRWQRKG